MLRVGIVTEWFDRGSSYVSRAYDEVFQSNGIITSIFARTENRTKHQSLWEHEHLYRARPCSLHKPKAIRKDDFLRWLRSFQPDIVLFNEQVWPWPVHWANEFGAHTVAYIDYYTTKSMTDFQMYDMLICNTERHYSAFEWHPAAHYVPWGTNLGTFRPRLEKVPLDDGGVTFLHSAGWSPERKGTDVLLRAFSLVNDANARLNVAMQCPVTQLQKLLGPDASRLLSDPRLTLVDEAVGPDFYQSGDVYVYPSRLEGIGLTQVEALASGLPLVVPDEAPMSQFARAPFSRVVQVASRHARVDDYYWPEVEIEPHSLAEAMSTFTDAPVRRSSWRQATREYAECHLDWHQNSKVLPELLIQLVREPKTSHPPLHRISCAFESWMSTAPTALARAVGFAARIASGLSRRFPSVGDRANARLTPQVPG